MLANLLLGYDSNLSFFDVEDKNICSNGQVDCFFEKGFTNKKGFVFMDGQGKV